MVYYPRPKFITKAHVRNARPYKWSDIDKRADQNATVATCMRCAQGVVNLKKQCDKPEHTRCEHCTQNNRGGCNKVPSEMNGRLNRLYVRRAAYDAAVTAAATPRTDAAVIQTGIRLARCQRTFNLELANRRQVARRTGVPLGVATQTPTTSPQFLGLILAEQRRIATALEQLVGHAARMTAPADDYSDDSDEEDPPGGAGGAQAPVGGEGSEDESGSSSSEAPPEQAVGR